MANVGQATATFHEAERRLALIWEETRSVWRDAQCQLFQHDYWEPIEAQVMTTWREMRILTQEIADIQRHIP